MALFVGGYTNDVNRYVFLHKWDTGLSSYSASTLTNGYDYYFPGKIAKYISGKEIYLTDEYDRFHTFDSVSGAYKSSTDLYPTGTFQEIYSITVDETNGHIYIGIYDNYNPSGRILQVDASSKTILTSIGIPDNGVDIGGLVVLGNYLYAFGQNNKIYKYSIPTLSYVSSVTHATGFLFNSMTKNEADGYIYAGTLLLGNGLIRYNTNTDTIDCDAATVSGILYYGSCVDTTTKNVYSLTKFPSPIQYFIERLNPDLTSGADNFSGELIGFGNNIGGITQDTNYIYAVSLNGNVYKVNKSTWEITTATGVANYTSAIISDATTGLYFRSTGTNAGYYTKDSTSPSLLTSKDSNGMMNAGGSPSPYLDYSTATDFYRKEF